MPPKTRLVPPKTRSTPTDPAEEPFNAMTYTLDHLMGLPPEHPIRSWIDHNVGDDFEDFLCLNTNNLSDLKYPVTDEDGVTTDKPLKAGHEGKVMAFIWWNYHLLNTVYTQPGEKIPWETLTKEEFGDFCVRDYIVYSRRSATELRSSKPPHEHEDEELKNFAKGVKRDASAYPVLKEEKGWDDWARDVRAQAEAQDLGEVLNPTYTPPPGSLAVFGKKKIFMYAVFNRCVKTSAGQAIVRAHANDSNAQKIWSELLHHSKLSTQANLDSGKILEYITTARVDVFRGSSHDFVLNWLEQVRLYNGYVKAVDKFNDSMLFNFLKNAVRPEAMLATVENSLELTRVTSSGGTVTATFQQYVELLKSACTTFDSTTQRANRSNQRPPHVRRSNVHEHEIVFDSTTDIDTLRAYQHSTLFDTPFEYEDTPLVTIHAHLHKAQWEQLDDTEKALWDSFSPRAKSIITGRPTRPERGAPRTTPVGTAVNLNSVTSVEDVVNYLHQLNAGSDDSTEITVQQHSQNSEASQPPASTTTPAASANPAALSNLLTTPPRTSRPTGTQSGTGSSGSLTGTQGSGTSGTRPSGIRFGSNTHNVSDIISRFIVRNVNITYKSSQNQEYKLTNASSRTSLFRSLVDRGANGGLAGDDVRVIDSTDRRVNVTGIENHQIADVKICTVGAYSETQRGPVILIMHQYAHTGRGRTIHSSAQLEWYKNIVCDKSAKVGGEQKLTTNDNYVMPIDIIDGLPYIEIRPYTDDEWDKLPHVIMTGDTDWDPSVLDNSHDKETWFDSISDTTPETRKTPFNDVGNYTKVSSHVTIAKHHFSDEFLKEKKISTVNNLDEIIDYCAMTHLESRQSREQTALMDGFVDDDLGDDHGELAHGDGHGKSLAYLDAAESEDQLKNMQSYGMQVTALESEGHKPPIPPKPGASSDGKPSKPTDDDIKSGPAITTVKEPDYDALRPFFMYLPADTIKKTFDVSTQHARYPQGTNLKKMFKTAFPACNVPRRNEDVATDTFYSDTPAVYGGQVIAQLFVGRVTNVTDIYALKSGKQFVNSLQDNIRQRGAMDRLLSDRAQVEIGSRVVDILRAYAIGDWQSEPYHQHQNYAENRYQTVKDCVNRLMDRENVAADCWLLCTQYVAHILNRTAHESLGWITPIQALTGQQPDISNMLRFKFYQPVYYHLDDDEDKSFPSDSVERRGRFVGIAENVGNAMVMLILDDEHGTVLNRSRARPADDPDSQNRRVDSQHIPNDTENGEKIPTFIRSATEKEAKELTADVLNSDDFDAEDLIGKSYLSEEQSDGTRYRCEIVRALKEQDLEHGKSRDRQKYIVSVNNDEYEEIVAYNEILDYVNRDSDPEDVVWRFESISAHQGPLSAKHKDYKGSSYNVLVNWPSGESTYEPLHIIAADAPVPCALYARKNGLLDTDGWRRFKRIATREKKLIRMVNQAKLHSYRSAKVYMYGYQVPRNHQEAMDIDAKNKNTKWRDSEILELSQLDEYDCFEDKGHGTGIPKDFKKIRVHMVYAVKHDGRHKSRLVAGGHLTDVPVDSVYSGVVSLRGLRLVLFLAELNDLDTYCTDIGNAYLEATTAEKVCIIAGPEFGELQGHLLIIRKALYGLRSSGKRWHEMLADTLRDMGFTPSRAEGDIWMRKSEDGKIYEYIAVYVDDLAIAARDPMGLCNLLMKKYNYKLKGTGPIAFHLGCDFFRDVEGVLCFAPKRYIDKMVDSYERMFGEKPRQTYSSPLESNDHPEVDDSPVLESEEIRKYQSLIGALQWAVSIGRMDVTTAVMTMSGYRVAPRKGHMDRVKRIYGYLLRFREATIRILTDEPDFSGVPESTYDWMYSVYGEVKVLEPKDAPEPLGKRVTTITYVDANLYHDMVTGRSVTGILHMLNRTPIDWYSRKQGTVETATYGSEFVAARTATDQIMDLRLTLQYLGVPLFHQSFMFGDNKSVVDSSNVPHSKLHKRHQALSFHRVREAVASRMLRFIHLEGKHNPADILSKHWGYQAVKELLKYLLLNARPAKTPPQAEGE